MSPFKHEANPRLAAEAVRMARSGQLDAAALTTHARLLDRVGDCTFPLACARATVLGRIDAHPDDAGLVLALGLLTLAANPRGKRKDRGEDDDDNG